MSPRVRRSFSGRGTRLLCDGALYYFGTCYQHLQFSWAVRPVQNVGLIGESRRGASPFEGQARGCSSSSHRRPAHLPPSPLDCRLARVSLLRITVPSTACTPLSDHIASLMKTFHQQSGDQAALHNGQTFPELALTCLFSSCFCMPRCAHIYVSY